MPVDTFANMEEKLWILEDLNMMYIRQIALSLQVKVYFKMMLTITCLSFFLLFFALTSPVFTQSHSCGECGHVSPLLTSFFLIDCLSQGEQADAFCVSCVCSCGPACCNFPDQLGKGSFYNGPYRSSWLVEPLKTSYTKQKTTLHAIHLSACVSLFNTRPPAAHIWATSLCGLFNNGPAIISVEVTNVCLHFILNRVERKRRQGDTDNVTRISKGNSIVLLFSGPVIFK